jgi:hypothetical protein
MMSTFVKWKERDLHLEGHLSNFGHDSTTKARRRIQVQEIKPDDGYHCLKKATRNKVKGKEHRALKKGKCRQLCRQLPELTSSSSKTRVRDAAA